jgi:hypothetical protein
LRDHLRPELTLAEWLSTTTELIVMKTTIPNKGQLTDRHYERLLAKQA